MIARDGVTKVPNYRRWSQHICEIGILHISQIHKSHFVAIDIIQLQSCPPLVLAPKNKVKC